MQEFTEFQSPDDLQLLTQLTAFLRPYSLWGTQVWGCYQHPLHLSIPLPQSLSLFWVGKLSHQARPWELCTQGRAGGLQGLGCCSRPRHSSLFPHTRPPVSWNLEGLQALGPLATYISPSLWMQVQEVGQCPGVR